MPLKSLDDTIDIHHIDLSKLHTTRSVPPIGLGPAVNLFEKPARKTWNRLNCSLQLNVSQGEETLTDNNLLEIKMSGIKQVAIWKCPKDQEKKAGIDWDWLIGSDVLGWVRYAVQAKKLNLETYRYDCSNHKVKKKA